MLVALMVLFLLSSNLIQVQAQETHEESSQLQRIKGRLGEVFLHYVKEEKSPALMAVGAGSLIVASAIRIYMNSHLHDPALLENITYLAPRNAQEVAVLHEVVRSHGARGFRFESYAQLEELPFNQSLSIADESLGSLEQRYFAKLESRIAEVERNILSMEATVNAYEAGPRLGPGSFEHRNITSGARYHRISPDGASYYIPSDQMDTAKLKEVIESLKGHHKELKTLKATVRNITRHGNFSLSRARLRILREIQRYRRLYEVSAGITSQAFMATANPANLSKWSKMKFGSAAFLEVAVVSFLAELFLSGTDLPEIQILKNPQLFLDIENQYNEGVGEKKIEEIYSYFDPNFLRSAENQMIADMLMMVTFQLHLAEIQSDPEDQVLHSTPESFFKDSLQTLQLGMYYPPSEHGNIQTHVDPLIAVAHKSATEVYCFLTQVEDPGENWTHYPVAGSRSLGLQYFTSEACEDHD